MKRLAFAILIAILPGLAAAQDRPPTPRARPALTGNPIDDIKAGIGGGNTSGGTAAPATNDDKIAQWLAKPFTDLANFINSDAIAAAQLAIAIPELQDGHGQQCWLAMGQFTAVLKAHPIPLTLRAMDDLEALRLAAMAANNICKNASCTQVFADLANGIQQVAPVSLGIPIPSLNALCSKVPVVTVVPPVPMPAVAPAAPTNP